MDPSHDTTRMMLDLVPQIHRLNAMPIWYLKALSAGVIGHCIVSPHGKYAHSLALGRNMVYFKRHNLIFARTTIFKVEQT